ncbi:hypothetical protein B0H14DRAFT_2595859 [Mycena olivaceomarginata]|nr:hypothetical protein B0H14DRAFT_2595859 [Mycena olivaceomarginata]
MRWDKSQGPVVPPNVPYDDWRPSGLRGKKRKATGKSSEANKKPTRRPVGPLMRELNEELQRSWAGLQSLENTRDVIRALMHSKNCAYFPYGPNMTSIDRIAEILLPCMGYGSGTQSQQAMLLASKVL